MNLCFASTTAPTPLALHETTIMTQNMPNGTDFAIGTQKLISLWFLDCIVAAQLPSFRGKISDDFVPL